MSSRRKRPTGEAHVRLYWFELDSPAWRTLSVDARALLIELRALFDPKRGDNRVFMGIRRAMELLGIGQRRVEAARDELLERGWITVAEQGSFNRKVRHSTTYALENESPTNANGAVPSKKYMRWQSTESRSDGSRHSYREGEDGHAPTVCTTATDAKTTVGMVHTIGSCGSYRHQAELVKKWPDGSRHNYRESDFSPSSVAATTTQILLPRGCGDRFEPSRPSLTLTDLLALPDRARLFLLFAWLVDAAGLVPRAASAGASQ